MPEFKSDSGTGRVMKNGLFVALRFGVYTLAGILFIPFLVDQYGKGSYGLIALAGFLTQYVGRISSSVGSSVARFLNVALNKNDWEEASEIFSTALAANVGLVLLQLPIYALCIWKLEWIMEFPVDVATDFRILVACNVLIFMIGTSTGILYTPLQAANRVDLGAKIDTARYLVRIALLIGLVLHFGAKLWIIGVVDLGLAILHVFIGYVYYRRLAQNLVFKWSRVSRKWFRPVLDMAGWMLVFGFGQALFVKTDVWVVNRFVDADMAGVYAALLVWPNFLRQVGNQIEALIMPVYIIDYAKGSYDRIAESCMFLYRTLSYFAAVVGGVFCGFVPWILKLWLGEEFMHYAPLLWIMIFYVVLTLNKAVTWPIFPCFNKANQLGLTTLLCGALNLGLSIKVAVAGWGAIGVAVVTLVTLFLLFGILYPWCVSGIVGIKFRDFLFCHLQTIFLFLLIALPIVATTMELPFILSVPVALLVVVVGSMTIWKKMYGEVEKNRIMAELNKMMGKLQGFGK